MSVLDKLRSAVPASARERVYVIAAAAVTLLASWGTIDAATAPAWAALVASAVTLAFAILHSTSTVRTALYSTLLTVQGVAQVYGILSDVQWASIAGLAAAVLGLSVAAAKSPTPISDGHVTVSIDEADDETIDEAGGRFEYPVDIEYPTERAGGSEN